jgi:N-formylglutamate amidohydrolase
MDRISDGFDILAPRQWSVPALINVPHAGQHFPDGFLSKCCVSEHELRRSEDCFVDDLFSPAVDMGVPLLRAHFSRSFVDLNREPFELDQKLFAERLPGHFNISSPRVACGLGILPRISGEGRNIYAVPLTLEDALTRIDTYYRPYHRTLASLLDEAHRATGFALLIDCHSMPSTAIVARPGEEKTVPDIVLGDRHGSACDPELVFCLQQAFEAEGLKVRLNKPYSGGFITETHGHPREGRHAVQIEINRAIYMHEEELTKSSMYNAVQKTLMRVVQRLLQNLPSNSEHRLAAE